MAQKIEVKGSYFYITDTVSGEVWKVPSKDLRLDEKGKSFYFYDTLNIRQNITVDFDDATDLNDASFANEAALVTFVEENTGFNTASGSSGADYSEFHLTTTPETINLNDDGTTYTKVPNMVLNVGKGFTVATGTLTKTVKSGLFLINGVSDLEVNKAVAITYALFVNGNPVPSELTPHTFSVLSKIENISITAIATINDGDDIDVRVKGDGTAAVEVIVRKLDVTFLEIL